MGLLVAIIDRKRRVHCRFASKTPSDLPTYLWGVARLTPRSSRPPQGTAPRGKNLPRTPTPRKRCSRCVFGRESRPRATHREFKIWTRSHNGCRQDEVLTPPRRSPLFYSLDSCALCTYLCNGTSNARRRATSCCLHAYTLSTKPAHDSPIHPQGSRAYADHTHTVRWQEHGRNEQARGKCSRSANPCYTPRTQPLGGPCVTGCVRSTASRLLYFHSSLDTAVFSAD